MVFAEALRESGNDVQQTLYAMGEAALAACADATEITLTLPNRHHLLVDLAPFGLTNENEIFVATSSLRSAAPTGTPAPSALPSDMSCGFSPIAAE